MDNKRHTVVSLRLASAQLEKLADDVEHNSLWPGEFEKAIINAEKAIQDAVRSNKY